MLLECVSVEFYSAEDENAFFNWLKALNCVEKIHGKGLSILINTEESVDDDCLRELLAIFYRYKIDMAQLSVFRNKTNEDWFYNNKQAYWYNKVFEME